MQIINTTGNDNAKGKNLKNQSKKKTKENMEVKYVINPMMLR